MKKDQIVKYLDTYAIPEYLVDAIEYRGFSKITEIKEEVQAISLIQKIGNMCPEGNILEWGEQTYFSSSPEFGLPGDVVDLRVYKILKNVTLEDAPINDKDIDSDFYWVTNNEYTESCDTEDKIHRLLFWNSGCVCLLKYRMYDNWMSVQILDDSEGSFDMAHNDIKQKLSRCLDSSEELYIQVDEENGGYTFMCRFYYIMEVVNGEK